ncbi:MAG: hypothetical protein HY905_11720 [Deltaproteobacteria bacterium]|nr:hypothetical protein [Deltaproteobacteria bacterium]
MFCARQGTGLETRRLWPGKRSMAALLVCCILAPTACYGSYGPNHDADHSLPDEAATPDAHPEAVRDVTFDDGDAGEPADEVVEVALEDATGEDAAEDGEAGCVWSGEYVRAADGGCWLERDATMLEPVVEECCTCRLCSYACGPCVPPEECDPGCIRDTRWCLCSSPGPPVAETDRWTCNTYPQWNGTAFNVLVVVPLDPAALIESGVVLVRFSDEVVVRPGTVSANLAALGVTSIESVDSARGVFLLRFCEEGDVVGLAGAFGGLPHVEWASTDPRIYPDGPSGVEDGWHLTAMGAQTAWTITEGDPAVVVAVIEQGVRGGGQGFLLDHPDLAPRLWTNNDEFPGDQNSRNDAGEAAVVFLP